MQYDFEQLVAKAGSYGGQGVDTLVGPVHGELELTPLRSRRAVMVRFSAFRVDGTKVHDQLGWIAPDDEGDAVSMWSIVDEGRGLRKFARRFDADVVGSDHTLAFACGDPQDPSQWRAETALDLYGDGSIGMRLRWGRPGEPGATHAIVRMSATFTPPEPAPF
ncbi:MAG: hypothetical protein AAGA48_34650 [Myxococcota bacterium]